MNEMCIYLKPETFISDKQGFEYFGTILPRICILKNCMSQLHGKNTAKVEGYPCVHRSTLALKVAKVGKI